MRLRKAAPPENPARALVDRERIQTLAAWMAERERSPRERLLEYQRERLRETVRHAVANSPYYRRVIGDAGGADIELRRLPVLTKSRLMAEFDRIVTDRRLRLADADRHLAGDRAGEPLNRKPIWRTCRMSNPASGEPVAHLVGPCGAEILDVMGPTIQFLVGPEAEDGPPCVMRGTIPPGVSVPLHSHPDPETFPMVAGELEGWTQSAEGPGRVRIGPGAVFHVPGGAKHAFRNRSREPAVSSVITTPGLGRFFREVGRPVIPGAQPLQPPSDVTIRRFLETAGRYGHWIATPEENARIGLLSP